MAAAQGFASSVYPLRILGVTIPGYAALYSVVVNFFFATSLSLVLDFVAKRG